MGNVETLLLNRKIKIEKFVLGSFNTNAYIITCQNTGQSVLLDAPSEAETLMKYLNNTYPQYILLTHAHPDHIGALSEIKKQLELPLAAHEAETQNLPLIPDLLLEEGSQISFGELQFKVLHTPGHTPGSLCYRAGTYLFAGDTLFPGGPGKTFSPEGFSQILESISHKLFLLPEETIVLPGHGDSTTIKKEKEEYKIFSSREHHAELYGDVEWLNDNR